MLFQCGYPTRSYCVDLFASDALHENHQIAYLECAIRAGDLRTEFKYLKARLEDDLDIALASVVRRVSPEENERPARGLFTEKRLKNVDVIILGDVSPALLTPAFLQSLDDAVRHQGVGLIVAAGPQYMPHAYGEPLRSLLPVRLADKAAGYDAPGPRAFSFELSAEGTLWEAMRFADRHAENQLIWKSLPSYEWCWPARSPTRSAAGASTPPR